MKKMIFTLFKKLGLIPRDAFLLSNFNFYPNPTKRLDEFRELIETIERETNLFSSRGNTWSRVHALETDKLLSELHQLSYASKCNLRPIPTCLTVEATPEL